MVYLEEEEIGLLEVWKDDFKTKGLTNERMNEWTRAVMLTLVTGK